MGKNVCSLVLSEEIIQKVDREALLKNTSRSQVIHDILCEHYHITTPSLKMFRVMELLSSALSSLETLDLVSSTPGSTLQIKTTVPYKYNPTLKYVIDLSGKDSEQLAVLKIYSRTVSGPFLQSLLMFFNFLTDFEESIHQTIGHRPINSSGYAFEDNKFTRSFACKWTEKGLDPEIISRYLTNYIQYVDESMKSYFDSKGNWKLIDQNMKAIYKKYW